MEAELPAGYHQSCRQSCMRPSTNLGVGNRLVPGDIRSEHKSNIAKTEVWRFERGCC